MPDTSDVRDRLALALDVDDLVDAMRTARELREWFGIVKVGLELFTSAGPDAVPAQVDEGFKVFLDLKLHDIPTTVEKAARVAGGLGASFLTLHAQGGTVMLRAGVDGLHAGAEAGGFAAPIPLAVTILTSDADAPPHILPKRVAVAIESGCGGLVCAASDVADAKELAPRMTTVVPGIRPAGADTHDQSRASTPGSAAANGADVLVIGRAVTQAKDRAAAAASIAAEVESALATVR
jgi:orotidine-5'-phosphate decarboxylase